MHPTLKAAPLVIVLVVALTSCGQGGGTTAAVDPPPSPGPSATASASVDPREEEALACERSGAIANATLIAADNPDGVEFDWKPAKIDLPAGEKVVLNVINRSYADHDFSSGSCYSGRIGAKESMKLSFVMPAEPVPFYCGLHAQGMTGKLVPR